jgi:predicted amidophosphoribosyltransferase
MREVCPNCGAELEPNAKVCPECGSDERTGWSEDAKSDGLDLPDETFDYQEFVQCEFEGKTTGPRRSLQTLWWLVAAVVIIALAFLWFHR